MCVDGTTIYNSTLFYTIYKGCIKVDTRQTEKKSSFDKIKYSMDAGNLFVSFLSSWTVNGGFACTRGVWNLFDQSLGSEHFI